MHQLLDHLFKGTLVCSFHDSLLRLSTSWQLIREMALELVRGFSALNFSDIPANTQLLLLHDVKRRSCLSDLLQFLHNHWFVRGNAGSLAGHVILELICQLCRARRGLRNWALSFNLKHTFLLEVDFQSRHFDVATAALEGVCLLAGPILLYLRIFALNRVTCLS